MATEERDTSNSGNNAEVENVRVFIRVRPLSKKEEAEGRENIVVLDEKENLIVLNKDAGNSKSFKFDQIFNGSSTQVSG